MINKVERKKGYGSFFSYIDHKSIIFSNSKNSFLPQNRKLFYSGRHAIKYIIETIKLENTINMGMREELDPATAVHNQHDDTTE